MPSSPVASGPGAPQTAPSSHGVSPMATFAICATTVAVVDLATKQLAAARLGLHGAMQVPAFHGAVRLAVVLNNQSAFGVSLGRYTWHINLVLTLVALGLTVVLCQALTALDAWAPIMLGLIAGAAMGNLASLITSPRGVLDFIAVTTGTAHEVVFNLADVAACCGLLLLLRTAWAVVREIAISGPNTVVGARRPRPVASPSPALPEAP
jgi:signal peptidase II